MSLYIVIRNSFILLNAGSMCFFLYCLLAEDTPVSWLIIALFIQLFILSLFGFFLFRNFTSNNAASIAKVEERLAGHLDVIREKLDQSFPVMVREVDSLFSKHREDYARETKEGIETLRVQVNSTIEKVSGIRSELDSQLGQLELRLKNENREQVSSVEGKLAGVISTLNQDVQRVIDAQQQANEDVKELKAQQSLASSDLYFKVLNLLEQVKELSVAGETLLQKNEALNKELLFIRESGISISNDITALGSDVHSFKSLLASSNELSLQSSKDILNHLHELDSAMGMLGKRLSGELAGVLDQARSEAGNILEVIERLPLEEITRTVEKSLDRVTEAFNGQVSKKTQEGVERLTGTIEGSFDNLSSHLKDQLDSRSLDFSKKIAELRHAMEGQFKPVEETPQQHPKEAELKTVMQEGLKNTQNCIKRESQVTYERIDALLSIHNIIKLKSVLPVMSNWAVSADFGRLLLEQVASAPKGNIIDIGSGITTLLAGYMLKQNEGGKVYSLEHDIAYYEQTKMQIAQHGLEDHVQLYLAPLKKHVIEGESWEWYSLDNIELPAQVSLIIVDGPPGMIQKNSRFPAVPMLLDKISSDTVILLDDGEREDEKAIAEMWKTGYGMESRYIQCHKGAFVLKRADKRKEA